MKDLTDSTVNELDTGQYIFLKTQNCQIVGIYLGLESYAMSVIDRYFAEESNYFHYIITQEADLNDLYVKLLRYLLYIDLTVLPIKDNINSIEQEYLEKTGRNRIENGEYKIVQHNSEIGTIKSTSMFFDKKDLTVSIIKEQLTEKIKYSYVDGKAVRDYIKDKIKGYDKRKAEDLALVKERLSALVRVSPRTGNNIFIFYHEKVLPVEILRVEPKKLYVRYFYFWFKNEPLEWFRYEVVKENGYLHYTEQEIDIRKGIECYAYKEG